MYKALHSRGLRFFPTFLLACQHVMVMYAGAVAIPLVLGAALGLSKSDIAFLINADLFERNDNKNGEISLGSTSHH